MTQIGKDRLLLPVTPIHQKHSERDGREQNQNQLSLQLQYLSENVMGGKHVIRRGNRHD